MSSLPSGLEALQLILVHNMSHNNNVRRKAERDLHMAQAQNSEQFCAGLVQLLRHSDDQGVRSMCAVLLRKRLLHGEPMLCQTLSDRLQVELRQQLLEAIVNEQHANIRTQICDTVTALAQHYLFNRQWPQLLPFALECAAQKDKAELRCSAMFILGRLTDLAPTAMQDHVGALAQVYAQALNDPQVKVRVAALSAAAETLATVEPESAALPNYEPLVPAMLALLGAVLSAVGEDDEPAKEVLRCLVQIATDQPEFLRNHLAQLTSAMCQVGNEALLDDDIRQLSVEFMVAVAEGAPGMCRKSDEFVRGALELAVRMMLTVEDEGIDDWANKESEFDTAEDSNFETGEEACDRLAQALGGAKVIPIIMQMIDHALRRNDDWKFRYAALMALTQVVEVMPPEMLAQTTATVVGYTKDPHPRVRYAAINCIGQMSTDHGPTLQEFHSAICLPALMAVLDDAKYPRVQSHGAAAIINYAEFCETQFLAPYLSDLLRKLFELLKQGKRIVQEQCVTAIASIADSSEAQFQQFYSSFVPILMQIVQQCTCKDDLMFRGRALECVSFIFGAVGADHETCRADAAQVVSLTLGLVESGSVADDDPSYTYMLQTWTRICSVLMSDFGQFLPRVMPVVFRAARVEVKMEHFDIDDSKQLLIEMGDRRYGIDSTALEEKGIACSMLCSFAHDLRGQFFPFVKPSIETLVPLFDFVFDDDVRISALSTMPSLVQSCLEALAHGHVSGDETAQMLREIVRRLIEAVQAEHELQVLMIGIQALQAVLEASTELAQQGVFDDATVQAVVQALMRLVEKQHNRIVHRETRKKHVDFDEEEARQLDGENEFEDDLAVQLSEAMGALIKGQGEAFAPIFTNSLQAALTDMLRSPSVHQRTTGIYMLADCFEFLPASVACVPHLQHTVPLLFALCSEPESHVALAQASLYSLGVVAWRGAQAFAPFAQQACQLALDAYKRFHAKAATLENPASAELAESAADNATGAVQRICEHQSSALNVSEVLPLFLQMLPCRGDKIESDRIYHFLCGLVETTSAELLGANFANLPRVVAIFADAVGTEFVSGPLTERIGQILQQLNQLPAQVKQNVVAGLTPPQRQKLNL